MPPYSWPCVQSGGTQCRYSMESDHCDSECTLTPAHMQRDHVGTGSQFPRSSRPPVRKGRQLSHICRSFTFSTWSAPPKCEYRHLCPSCKKAPHRVADCPEPRGGERLYPSGEAAKAGEVPEVLTTVASKGRQSVVFCYALL